MDADTTLLQNWEQKFDACRRERTAFEQQWHLNLAFYFGRQYVSVSTKGVNNAAGYVLQDARPGEPWRVRAVRNKIKRTIRNEMTKLTKEEPQGYINPASSDDEDRLAAIAGEAIAEFFIASSNYKKKRAQATFWTVLCGTGFTKTYYDPTLVDSSGVAGTVTYEAVSPFHLFVPYLQLIDLEEQPYVIHARTVSADKITSLYGREVPPTTNTATSVLDQRYYRSLGIDLPKSDAIKQVYLKEVWVKPCREFPQGAMFIYADNTLLHMNEQPQPEGVESQQLATPTFDMPGLPQPTPREYPYKHGKFPFQKIDHIPTGMFYGESTIKDLIPVQKDYNRIRSQIMEFRNMAGKPQWWMKKGAFDPKQFTPKPGVVLPVNPGFEGPQMIEQPKLPEQTPMEIDLNNREFDDISGQFEISKGRTPPGVEAASAIAFLQEENDTILYHTVSNLEAAVEEAGRQTLNLIHQYWETERITRVISMNNELEASIFKDVNMKPDLDYRITTDSMAPRSRAAKQAVISDLMKNQAITPQQGLRYMQFNETNRLYKELQVDVDHAQRENLYMAMGRSLTHPLPAEQQPQPDPMNPMAMPQPAVETKQIPTGVDPLTGQQQMVDVPVTTNPFDNDEVHIEEHSRWMKSQQYERLPPEQKQIFLDHLEEHKQKLIDAQYQAAMSQLTEQQPQEMGQP